MEIYSKYKEVRPNKVRSKDGMFTDTSGFRERGNFFMENEYYCSDPDNSPDWFEFWSEERKRCLEGYTVDGIKIPGAYYFYLNYCPIQKVDLDNSVGGTATKIKGFPDFWDGDFNYFWLKDIARYGILAVLGVSVEERQRIYELPEEEKQLIYEEHYNTLGLMFKPVFKGDNLEGGKDFIVGKSRRKGFSYKNASIAVRNYFHKRNSYNMLIAYEKKYLYPGVKTIFGKCQEYIAFNNDNTAFLAPSDEIDRQMHIKNSYYEVKQGKKIAKGMKGEIEAISFKDNPDAGRGADTDEIIGEEVGAWGTPGGLKATHAAMRSSTEGGSVKTGQMTFFGTGGSMEKGTVDFADMHRNPGSYNFMMFYDMFGDDPNKIEGFFFPRHLSLEKFYDEHGNSDLKGAKNAELKKRKILIDNGATTKKMQQVMQEDSLCSAEAFAMVSSNIFPVVELNRRLQVLKSNTNMAVAIPVNFIEREGKVAIDPILDGSANPILSYTDPGDNILGCPVIYEEAIPDCPRGLYKIGYDPIRQDTGTSLAGIVVYKSHYVGHAKHSTIVAEYVGRLESPDEIDRLSYLFAKYYNTEVMFENEVVGVKNYYRQRKILKYLASQPDLVISKNIKNSKVARVYGCHMNVQLKDAGERYTNDWLRTVVDYDEFGTPITVIDRLDSIRLIEELINYSREGNFDLVSALFMALIQVEEEVLGKVYGEEDANSNVNKLMKMFDNLY